MGTVIGLTSNTGAVDVDWLATTEWGLSGGPVNSVADTLRLRWMNLTRFDGHLTRPRLRAEVFDDLTTEGRDRAA